MRDHMPSISSSTRRNLFEERHRVGGREDRAEREPGGELGILLCRLAHKLSKTAEELGATHIG
jgi:hypothetical protein